VALFAIIVTLNVFEMVAVVYASAAPSMGPSPISGATIAMTPTIAATIAMIVALTYFVMADVFRDIQRFIVP
jgi:hypothetical protein